MTLQLIHGCSGPDVVLGDDEAQVVTFTAPINISTLSFSLQMIGGGTNFSTSDEITIASVVTLQL